MEQDAHPHIGIVKNALSFYWRVYWRTALAIFLFQMALLALWGAGMLGACNFDGTNMVECTFFGMDVNYLANSFIAVWMIPIIGIVFGLMTAPFAAVMTAFWICVAIFVFNSLKPRKETRQTTVSRD